MRFPARSLVAVLSLSLFAVGCTAQRAQAPSALAPVPAPDDAEVVEAVGEGEGEIVPAALPAPDPVDPATLTVRFRAVGDVMLGTDFPGDGEYLPPEGGAQMLAQVKDALADADLTFINLEGPLCDSGESTKCGKGGNCYAFRTPTSYVRWFTEAGVDLASTANNHAGDFGDACRRETEQTLDAAGIAWSGPLDSIATVTSNGLQVAMVAFHTAPTGNHVNDHEAAAALVAKAAESHDLVVVSFHGGAEGARALHVPDGPETFYGENRGHLRQFARVVIDAGAHAVIGHGPHVPRGLEFYKGRLIAYSLGNFATYGRFNLRGPNGLSAILELTLNGKGEYVSGKLLPTLLEGRGVPAPDPEGRSLELFRALSAEDFPLTGAVIDPDGTVRPQPEALPQS